MKKEKSCGCIIIENDKVLLVKQIDGHISFPKGHIEKNEQEKETALREVYEETGIKVNIIDDTRYVQKYIIDNKIEKEVVYFLAKKVEGTLKKQDSEILELGFYDINKALLMLTYEDTKNLFLRVLKDNNLL